MQQKAVLPEVPKKSKIKTSAGDKVISVITYVVYSFFAFVCVYPFYYIIINSISANNLSERGKIIFWPQEIHFKNYTSVFNLPGLWDAARTSVLRTVIGTVLTVMISAFLGYMFTRKTLWHRKLWYRMDNLPVPEEYGGGGYQDGNNAINQWLLASICTNPNTGETYDIKFWDSYKAKNMTEMKKEWQARFDAEDSVDWMKKNGKVVISPNCVATLVSDTNDISVLRNEINKVLCKYTWQMFAAESDDEFEALWDKMVSEMDGLDYQTLFDFDCAKWQVEVDAKLAAVAE